MTFWDRSTWFSKKSQYNDGFSKFRMTETSKLCDFKHFTETNCTWEFVHIFECDRNTQKHLTSLKSSESIPGRPFQSYDCPESLLILFRSGIFSVDQTALNLYICESHRVFFGLNWRRTKTRCTYPGHNTTSKAKSDRGTYPTLCKELFLKTRQILPVGSGTKNNILHTFKPYQMTHTCQPYNMYKTNKPRETNKQMTYVYMVGFQILNSINRLGTLYKRDINIPFELSWLLWPQSGYNFPTGPQLKNCLFALSRPWLSDVGR